MSTNKAEQAVAYAALILADDSIAVTPDKLQTLLIAAGIDNVEPIWTTLFAKALEGKDVKGILTKVAATGPAIGGAISGKSDEKGGKVADDDDKIMDSNEPNDDGSDEEDFGMSLFD
jgi:large subunit ribosomal protein LP1